MLNANEAKAFASQVQALGQGLFDFMAQHVEPIIQAAAAKGEFSAKLVDVTPLNVHFASVTQELNRMGYIYDLHPDASPSAQYLIVSWT